MAVGIEHRNSETLMQAFDNWKRPQWVIYCGKEPRDGYEDNNIDESRQYLEDCLEAITASGTNTVYTIRSYSVDQPEINSKTPFKASTTFMLGGAPVKTENGMIVIDRDARGVGNTGANLQTQSLVARLDKLEAENRSLQEKLFSTQLESIKREFENKISGLQPQEPKQELTDKLLALGQAAIDKPEIIDKLFSGLQGIGRLVFNRSADPQPEPAAQIAGTNQDQMKTTNQDQQDEIELSPEEQALYDRQEEALDAIEKKIGVEKLTEALEAIAKMNKAKLLTLLAMV